MREEESRPETDTEGTFTGVLVLPAIYRLGTVTNTQSSENNDATYAGFVPDVPWSLSALDALAGRAECSNSIEKIRQKLE